MKFKTQFLTILALMTIIIACNDDDNDTAVNSFQPVDIYENYNGEVYQISFYKMKTGSGETEIYDFLDAIAPSVIAQEGSIISDLVQITEPLIENSALPDVARPFDYDFMVLLVFPDEVKYQLAVNDANYIEMRTNFEISFTDVAVETLSLLAPTDNPNGGIPPPTFGSIPSRTSPPAFYLLNLAQVIQTPEAQQSLNEYFSLQVPGVIAAETIFTNQFVNVRVMRGNFIPTDFISLTEWKDQAAFNSIHEDPDRLANIFPLRNDVLLDLVEARAIALDNQD